MDLGLALQKHEDVDLHKIRNHILMTGFV